uniref:CUE domain-containing protein n=1 Tax=Timema cristinae TaxID=61476 RepID=A0A7R9CIM5_TIMCR|nr:unnamed protein product [Timema cristinae]
MATVQQQTTQLEFHQAMADFKTMFPDMDDEVIEYYDTFYFALHVKRKKPDKSSDNSDEQEEKPIKTTMEDNHPQELVKEPSDEARIPGGFVGNLDPSLTYTKLIQTLDSGS